MPGSTNFPVASITLAFAEALRFLPIAAIFPLRSKTSAFVIVPRVTVSTVAFRISVSVAALRSCANDGGRKMLAINEQIRTWIVSLLIIITLVIKTGTGLATKIFAGFR